MTPTRDEREGSEKPTLQDMLVAGLRELKDPQSPTVAEAVSQLHISPSPRIVTLDDIRDMGGNVEGHVVLKRGSYDLDFRIWVEGTFEIPPGTAIVMKDEGRITVQEGELLASGSANKPIVLTGDGIPGEFPTAISFRGRNANGLLKNVKFRSFDKGPEYVLITFSEGSQVELVDCDMYQTRARGIVGDDGTLSAEGCDFTNCNPFLSPYHYILKSDNCQITLSRCKVKGNGSEKPIIHVRGGNFGVTESEMEGNRVYKDTHSLIEVNGAETSLQGVKISANHADTFHILKLDGCIAQINDCLIFNNSIENYRAVIAVYNSKVIIDRKTRVVANTLLKGYAIGFFGEKPTIEEGAVIEGPISSYDPHLEILAAMRELYSNRIELIEGVVEENQRFLGNLRNQRDS